MTRSVHPDQLELLVIGLTLADQLADRRRVLDGAERLLIELIRQGLDEKALRPAAALVDELDGQAAARRNGARAA